MDFLENFSDPEPGTLDPLPKDPDPLPKDPKLVLGPFTGPETCLGSPYQTRN